MKKPKIEPKKYSSSYDKNIKALPETHALLLIMKIYGHIFNDQDYIEKCRDILPFISNT